MVEKNTAPYGEKIPLQLDWQFPDNVPTRRVTNALVELLGNEFVLSFFEQRGPIIITEDDREKVKKLQSIKALCVARICITPERMESFIKVFQQQYERYLDAVHNASEPAPEPAEK